MRTLMTLTVLMASMGALKAEETHSLWWRTKAEAACISDVVRLCKSAMPDEDKVTNCMESKRHLVSDRCASFYPGGTNAD